MARKAMTFIFLILFSLFLSISLQYTIIVIFDVFKIDQFLGEYAPVLFIILPTFMVSLILYFYSRENKKLSTATALITFFIAG